MKDFTTGQWYIVLTLVAISIGLIMVYMMMVENPFVLVLIVAIPCIALVMASRNLLTASLVSNHIINGNGSYNNGTGYHEVENNFYGDGPEMNIEGVSMLPSSEPLAQIAMHEYSDYADLEL